MKLAAQPLLGEIWNPEQWDQELNTERWEGLLNTYPDPGLRLIATLASRDARRIQDALALADAHAETSPFSRGGRLLALVDLERYAQVYETREEIAPTGSTPAELFDAANASFAVGMAAGALGKAEQSFAALHTALALASALRMRHRQQHVAVELEAVRTALGDASPARIRSGIGSLPMTERRSQRCATVLAEAYMALGAYNSAAAAAAPGSDLQAFIHALLGQPGPLPPADAGDYAPLALALSGSPVGFSGLISEPEAWYERIVKAHLMTREDRSAAAAAAILMTQPPRPADQRVLWAVLRWRTIIAGAAGHCHVTQTLQILDEALAELTVAEHVAGAIRRLAPEMFVLLAGKPSPHQIFGQRFTEVPILMGNYVLYQGRTLKLPGQTGSRLVADAALGKRRKLHPQERRRFREELESHALPQESVNAGWLCRALALTGRAVDATERPRWKNAAESLTRSVQGSDAVSACAQLVQTLEV